MENFRKRIITAVIVLSLAITGSYATESYKNSIMALDFETGTNGAVTMIIKTKNPYNNSINLVKKDNSTYVMMLPEFDNSSSTPNLSKTNNIISVDVQTRPYTSGGNGYTKLTIKTNGSASIFPQCKQFISSDNAGQKVAKPTKVAKSDNINSKQINKHISKKLAETDDIFAKQKTKIKNVDKTPVADTVKNDSTEKHENNAEFEREQVVYNDPQTPVQIPEEKADNSISIMAILALIGVLIAVIILLVLGKNKMSEVVGKDIDVNFDKEDNSTERKKSATKHSQPAQKISVKENSIEQVVVEKINVIDMDTLFASQNDAKPEQGEETNKNETLEDFLSDYYNEPEQTPQKEESNKNETLEVFLNDYYDEPKQTAKEEDISKKNTIDEEMYNSVLQNNALRFSSNDIAKITSIMENELSDDIKKQLKDNTVTNPITEPKQSLKLENIIADYFIKQNVVFTGKDIEIIHKLMNVELNNDFITDLRTNTKKVDIVQNNDIKLIPEKNEPNETIQTEIMKTNSVQEKEYDVMVLKVEDELPDLQDVLAHPEKYEEVREEEFNADENLLLQSLSNVQFKPFYTEENQTVFSDLSDNKTENHNVENDEVCNEYEEKEDTNDTLTTSDTNLLIQMNENLMQNNEEQLSNEQQNTNSLLIDNTMYNIMSVAYFDKNSGVYLTKTKTLYAVFGFAGEKIQKLKVYDTLKSEKITIRINNKFDNGTMRYLVKIGSKKFMLDFDGHDIDYVMDLC